MGYSSTFRGMLKFAKPISSDALGYLNTMLGEDRRKIGYADDGIYKLGYGTYWYHIDYKLTKDFSGIEWNGMEKAYDMEHIANFIIDRMKEKFPDFALSGKMLAQGEDIEDRWELYIGKDGRAHKKILPKPDNVITCPHCEGKFILNEAVIE